MMQRKKPARARKCAVCPQKFVPSRPFEKWCSPGCKVILARQLQDKANRKRLAKLKVAEREGCREIGAAKKSVKTKGECRGKAQDYFNLFIRLRDYYEPCICCGSYGPDDDWLTGGKWDAGHFLSRGGFPELRFEELNCHKQLKTCNGGSSRYADKTRTVAEGYEARLIEKIGLEAVEWLKGPHEPKRYTTEDYIEIAAVYRKKARELKKELGL